MWKKNHHKIIYIFLVFFVASLFINPSVSSADDEVMGDEAVYLSPFHINIDQPTIAKGYTVAAFNDAIKLSLVPGILSEATDVDISALNEDLPEPWQLDRASKVYQFEFRNKQAYDNHKPFYIQLSYDLNPDLHKAVFFYDKNYGAWRELPTKDFPEEKFVRSLIHLPYARIAVFSYPEIMTSGRASWYAYKNGNFAASPDFPKGSRLRVKNVENGKFVDVTINDYGPDRGLHPDRVIDLDKAAFASLASLGEGMIDVTVEPLYIAPDSSGLKLGIADLGAATEPTSKVQAAIVYDENTGDVIWEKMATTSRPLASLTKLVAVKVFLETEPDLAEVVAYKKQDENYNYEFCKVWESAKLKIDEGETLTIKDLIYVSLVGSANNTVETLVRVSGFERADFIARMNELVREWGASSTHFIEPTGLAPENVSSPLDYAIITTEVLKDPIIKDASTLKLYSFNTINLEKAHRIKNTNQMVVNGKFNITGSKTGYLDEAGYCLMTRAAGANGNVIVVTMGADNRSTSVYETEKLVRYGLRKTQ